MLEQYWTLCYCWHIQIMPIDDINTQTIFMVLFTSGSLLTWGKPLDTSSSISPRYLSTTYSQLTVSPFFYRHPIMTDYTFFSQGLDRWGKEMAYCGGALPSAPPTKQFHTPSITPAELSSLTRLKVWGEKQKISHDIAFLLIPAEEEAMGDRKYGLLTIWVNPCHARVSSMEEAVKELTAWVSIGPNWPYALVQLHKYTGAPRHPASKRGWDGCLWENQPAGHLATPCLWPAGCLPNRVWMDVRNLS